MSADPRYKPDIRAVICMDYVAIKSLSVTRVSNIGMSLSSTCNVYLNYELELLIGYDEASLARYPLLTSSVS